MIQPVPLQRAVRRNGEGALMCWRCRLALFIIISVVEARAFVRYEGWVRNVSAICSPMFCPKYVHVSDSTMDNYERLPSSDFLKNLLGDKYG